MFVKTHHAVHLKSIHVADGKSAKKCKKKNLFSYSFDPYSTHETSETKNEVMVCPQSWWELGNLYYPMRIAILSCVLL